LIHAAGARPHHSQVPRHPGDPQTGDLAEFDGFVGFLTVNNPEALKAFADYLDTPRKKLLQDWHWSQ
jgi:hypothetical protein